MTRKRKAASASLSRLNDRPTSSALSRNGPLSNSALAFFNQSLDTLPQEPSNAQLFRAFARALKLESAEIAEYLISRASAALTGNSATRAVQSLAMELLLELAPSGAVQCLLAAQIIRTNDLANEFAGRALAAQESDAAIDLNLNRAGKLNRLFLEQVEAFGRFKAASIPNSEKEGL
ncbi:MAG TPA: hypothetical protein VG297_24270 [Bryobacteraceae bacterium]|nr:hypothetical protein [Bryobacteraceae bacterium]